LQGRRLGHQAHRSTQDDNNQAGMLLQLLL